MSAIEKANNELKQAEEVHRKAVEAHEETRKQRANTKHAVSQARARLDNALNGK
jgi:hypothetical protein